MAVQCRTITGVSTLTNNDRNSAISLATEPQSRDPESKLNVGGLAIKKTDGTGAYGADVAAYLWSKNGTIVWDIDDPINGSGCYENIYQLIAADIYAPGANQRTRIEVSGEQESTVRSGVTSLAKWLDQQWELPMFRSKGASSGNRITVITVHPDFVIDEHTGLTAMESQRQRDRKAIEGQTKAAFRRLGREEGEDAARVSLYEIFSRAIASNLPKGRMVEEE